ncbi:MAG: deoxyribodipyrimidine photo-lyase [Nanoarchaeota archaeon]
MSRDRVLNHDEYSSGAVLYWMQRDQRVQDNWALLHAQKKAQEHDVPLIVCFSLVQSFLGATRRQYGFMLKGLQQVEAELKKYNIPFKLLLGPADETIPAFVGEENIGLLVTDFNPLHIKKRWVRGILDKVDITLHEVDAHNIIPCWTTSDKQEFAARTIRPKIHKKLEEYLVEFPKIHKQDKKVKQYMNTWDDITLDIDEDVGEISWIEPGEAAAQKALQGFIGKRLEQYAQTRNDPSLDGQSSLSPYFHFGHLSPQRAALEVLKTTKKKITEVLDPKRNMAQQGESIAAFIEEAVVRRELSDNFCYYNKNYDSTDGFPQWAQHNMKIHDKDKREYTYTVKELEGAKTHDKYWNAAQLEMVKTGKMHNYMRMYWAKRILEWTKDSEHALKTAIYLNDKYELDGRDPNGYVGCMWSIGGVHDRPWTERPIFGKIRYMNANGLKRKFDMEKYVAKML